MGCPEFVTDYVALDGEHEARLQGRLADIVRMNTYHEGSQTITFSLEAVMHFE